MIRKCLLVLLILSFCGNLLSQVTNEEYYDRLYYTCRAWGFVKYHHTRIADGQVDWDEALLESINGIKTAPDQNSFNDSLMVMLNKAGKMGSLSINMPHIPDSLNNDLDISWMQSLLISDNIRSYLQNIRTEFRPRQNIYVSSAYGAGNPTFNSDNKYYTDKSFPDEAKRTLALFRYWNIIYYFYPYKKLMDQDWNSTLKEFIPRIVSAPDMLSYTLAFKELTTRLCDTHAYFRSPAWLSWYGTAYPPFLVRFIENQMVITKVLPSVTGIHEGDIIKSIDGIEIHKLRDSLRRYSYGSNNASIELNLNEIILWGPAEEFPLTVNDGTNDKTITLARSYSNYQELYKAAISPAWQTTTTAGNCHFGVVDMGKLKPEEVEAMFSDLWKTDAIIFDIRNYPQATLWTIVDYLFDSPLHIANFTVPDITIPGRLYWKETVIGNGKKDTYEGTVIILFDERTLSQAEYTCMGLERFPGAVKIGSTTAAADGNVSTIYLPGEIFTNATFLGTYYPDYEATQRIGIIPDVYVSPTIQGIRERRDELMEVAMDCRIENEIAKLYPNPTKGILHYDAGPDGKPLEYEIYDMLGRRLMNGTSSSGTIDISSLSQGYYIFKVIRNRHVLSKKILRY